MGSPYKKMCENGHSTEYPRQEEYKVIKVYCQESKNFKINIEKNF